MNAKAPERKDARENKNSRDNSVCMTEQPSTVPTGLIERGADAFPALKRWAIVKRPYGTDVRRAVGKVEG